MLLTASETRLWFDGGGTFFCCLKQDLQDLQDLQDESRLGEAQRLWRQRHPLFRSVRT